MLQRKIGLEVVVKAKVEGLAISIAPVFAVLYAVLLHLCRREPCGPLLVLLRRAKRCKEQCVVVAEALCYGEHIGKGVYLGALHIAISAHIRGHKVKGPPVAQLAAVYLKVALEGSKVGAVESCLCFEALCGRICYNVY